MSHASGTIHHPRNTQYRSSLACVSNMASVSTRLCLSLVGVVTRCRKARPPVQAGEGVARKHCVLCIRRSSARARVEQRFRPPAALIDLDPADLHENVGSISRDLSKHDRAHSQRGGVTPCGLCTAACTTRATSCVPFRACLGSCVAPLVSMCQKLDIRFRLLGTCAVLLAGRTLGSGVQGPWAFATKHIWCRMQPWLAMSRLLANLR